MAHNLATKADGTAAMFYTGESPWHGLGTHLANPATSAEAMAASGLDFTIEMHKMKTEGGLEVPMGQAVVRSDTSKVLGMVGNRWRPVQNSDAFSFLDSLVGEDQIRYHTAGALGDGQRVWMLAQLGDTIRVTGTDDLVGKFLLLSNSHDGFGSLRCFFTPIRVVCQNTLNAAEKTAQRQGVVIRHTGNISTKIDEARRVLGLADAYYNNLQAEIDAMAKTSLNRAKVLSYFQAVYPAPPEEKDSKRAKDNAQNTWDALLNLYENGKGNNENGVRHTLWAAYNAVTEFIDHENSSPRDEKKSLEAAAESRLNRIWFGTGASVKGSAYEKAMKMMMDGELQPEPVAAPAPKGKGRRKAAAAS
jgi:phage/plasmid-like protein (TIGR03299 family)